MNTRQVIDDSAGPVSLSAAFNSDSSCFSVGLDTGFCGTLRRIPAQCKQTGAHGNDHVQQSSTPIRVNSKCQEVRSQIGLPLYSNARHC